jgi:hypothetical protein
MNMIKNFISTLAAILVAAAVIFGIRSCIEENNRLVEQRVKTERIIRESKGLSALREKTERETFNFGQIGSKPTATATATPANEATLTRPLDVPLKYGSTKLPVGTKLKVLARKESSLFVDFSGETFEIPIDATNVR